MAGWDVDRGRFRGRPSVLRSDIIITTPVAFRFSLSQTNSNTYNWFIPCSSATVMCWEAYPESRCKDEMTCRTFSVREQPPREENLLALIYSVAVWFRQHVLLAILLGFLWHAWQSFRSRWMWSDGRSTCYFACSKILCSGLSAFAFLLQVDNVVRLAVSNYIWFI